MHLTNIYLHLCHVRNTKKRQASLGRVVRKPVNVKPGLKVNSSIAFSYFKVFFTSNFWFSLRLLQLKTEGQTIKTNYLTKRLQN